MSFGIASSAEAQANVSGRKQETAITSRIGQSPRYLNASCPMVSLAGRSTRFPLSYLLHNFVIFTCSVRYLSHTLIVLFNKQILERISGQLHRSDSIVDTPLQCDRWVASSVLQKAIRRGEVELAQRAAFTIHAFDRNAIWRRLIAIGCEDVGVGDIDALLETVLAATSTDVRRQCGEAAVLRAVVHRLAEAVKDRSADYLACAAKDHSALSEIRDFCRTASLEQRLRFLGDTSRPLAQRAVAAWFASGINWRYDQ